jgi:hypothetical protein
MTLACEKNIGRSAAVTGSPSGIACEAVKEEKKEDTQRSGPTRKIKQNAVRPKPFRFRYIPFPVTTYLEQAPYGHGVLVGGGSKLLAADDAFLAPVHHL